LKGVVNASKSSDESKRRVSTSLFAVSQQKLLSLFAFEDLE
jgi:hypothetical protein